MSVSSQLAAMVGNITDGGITSAEYDFGAVSTLDGVKRVFAMWGLHWNPIVEHDAINALNDDSLDYFTDFHTFAEQGRCELGIPTPEPRGGCMRAIGEICLEITQRWKRDRLEVKRYGVAVSQFLENEWACPVEQDRFYRTDAWRRCSAAQRYVWGYACKICNVRGAGLHVHHNNPIMSGYGHNFDLNFAPWKLSLMCEDCHRAYHSRAVRNHAAHEYFMETEQEAAKDRAEIRQTWKVVHKLGLCRYCECHPYEARP